jgi:hypothetical protein
MHPFLAALACLSLAPALGGLTLRARPSPQRQRWLTFAGAALGEAPLPRLPLGITDDRLFGGEISGRNVSKRASPCPSSGLLSEYARPRPSLSPGPSDRPNAGNAMFYRYPNLGP